MSEPTPASDSPPSTQLPRQEPALPRAPRRWGRVLALVAVLGLGAGAWWAHETGWDEVLLNTLADPAHHPWRQNRPERPPLVLTRSFPKPARPWKIVVDAGHGGTDPGTHNNKENLSEAAINLKIALAFAERLTARGDMKVTLTRKDDRKIKINRRVKISKDTKPDVFVSIHANGGGAIPGSGFMSIWSQRQRGPAAERSPWLASWVGAALLDAGFRPTRPGMDLEDPRPAGSAAYRSSWHTYGGFATDSKMLGVLDYNRVPAVLVETHHRDNPVEVAAFEKPETIARFVEGLELGLLNYLHAPDGPKNVPEAAPEGGFWTVQVLATSAKPDAERIAGTLRKAGYDDVQVAEHVDPEQQAHYRVRVGKLAARSGLKPLQERLQTEGYTETWALFEAPAPADTRAPAGAAAPKP